MEFYVRVLIGFFATGCLFGVLYFMGQLWKQMYESEGVLYDYFFTDKYTDD